MEEKITREELENIIKKSIADIFDALESCKEIPEKYLSMTIINGRGWYNNKPDDPETTPTIGALYNYNEEQPKTWENKW